MTLPRKLAVAVASAAFGVSLVGLSAPAAHAGDSSWGCGGACRGTGDPGTQDPGAEEPETP